MTPMRRVARHAVEDPSFLNLVLTIGVIVLALLGAGEVVAQVRAGDAADAAKRSSRQALAASRQASAAVHAIQVSRQETIWKTCMADGRHLVEFTRRLDRELAQAPASDPNVRAATLRIVGGFLPFADCPRQLHDRLGVRYPPSIPSARSDWRKLDREHRAQRHPAQRPG